MRNYLTFFKRFIVLSIIISVVFFACIKPVANVQSVSTTKYSGEEMFNAIFFLRGEAVLRIKSYNNVLRSLPTLTAEQRKSMDIVSNDIINNIKKTDPTFFNRFKEAITSKNMFVVQNGIISGGVVIQKAIHAIPKYNLALQKMQRMTNKYEKSTGVLSASNKIDLKKLNDYKNVYFSTDQNPADAACTPVAGFCVVYLVGAAIQEAALAVNVVAGVTVVLWKVAFIFTKGSVVNSGGHGDEAPSNGKSLAFIADVSQAFS